MNGRRLAIATLLAEAARPLAVVILITISAGVVGLVYLASLQLHPAVRSLFVGLLATVLVVPYSVKVFQIFRALRRPDLTTRGVRLERESGERLYALVEETTSKLGTPAPRAIWVAMSFDLGVVQLPRGYAVVLGLALLDCVTPSELKALVATAVARSYSGDALAARAYRCAMRWAEVLTSAAGRGNAPGVNAAAIVAGICLHGLDAQRLVARRETDARDPAGRVSSPTAVAAGLIRASMYESYADEVFWPSLIARHTFNDRPPDGISQLRSMCRAPLPDNERRRRRNRAIAELGLAENAAPADEPDVRVPASDLVDVAPALTRAFDDAWRVAITATWTQLHGTAAAQAAELCELEEQSAQRGLTNEEAWTRLVLIEARQGAASVLPGLARWTEANPTDAQGLFHAGRVMLSLGQADGIRMLERAVELDDRYTAEGSGLMAAYLRDEGRETEAAEHWRRHEVAAAQMQNGLTERAKLPSDATFIAHGLRAHEVAVIVEHLRRFAKVTSATISRRETPILPKIPLIVLGVRFKRDAFWWTIESAHDVLARIADIPLPIQVICVDIRSSKRLALPPAVEIYRAPVTPRSVIAARWGRRGQVALIAIGIFFVLRASFINRDCFPDCWLKPEAFFYLVPLIAAVNVLLLTGSPDTPARRAAAFLASLLFVSEFVFSGWWTLFLPFALVALLRTPATRRSLTWTFGMALPVLALGMIVGRS